MVLGCHAEILLLHRMQCVLNYSGGKCMLMLFFLLLYVVSICVAEEVYSIVGK